KNVEQKPGETIRAAQYRSQFLTPTISLARNVKSFFFSSGRRHTRSFHQAISRTGFAINRNTCLLQSLYISINCPLANLKLRGKILRFYNGLGLQLKVDGEDSVKSLSDVDLVKLNILRKKRIIRWIRKESLPLRSLYQYRQMNKALIALACGGLAIGMTEFTMMGILPD